MKSGEPWKIFIFIIFLSVTTVLPQDAEVVTFEMLGELEKQILDLNARIGPLQDEMAILASQIQSFASTPLPTPAPGNGDVAGIQDLIAVSNKQEEDITKLFYTNGIWQKNFKVINSTFEKLRKVVVFPSPMINSPVALQRPRRLLPVVENKANVTVTMKPTRPAAFSRRQ